MSEMGHSRPMHLVPVPINVRCYSNSNPIVRRSEVTLRARKRHVSGSKLTTETTLWIEDRLLDVLEAEGVGCIGFSALAQGLQRTTASPVTTPSITEALSLGPCDDACSARKNMPA